MTRKEIVNNAAHKLLDAGCDLVSIVFTWKGGGATESLMMEKSSTEGGDEKMAGKKSPAGKKKPAAKMPMPDMPMKGKGMGKKPC